MLTKIIYLIFLLIILIIVDNVREKFTNSRINKLKYKIYWINMNKSINRRIWMENQFKKFNVLYNERIKAIDGKKMNYNNLIIEDINKYKNSEIACTLSHLKAIKKAYDNNDEICYVMEDDISLDLINNWKITIDVVLKQIPKDWEIINLSLSSPNILEDYLKLDESNIFSKWADNHTSTLCYIINRYLK